MKRVIGFARKMDHDLIFQKFDDDEVAHKTTPSFSLSKQTIEGLNDICNTEDKRRRNTKMKKY